ncbi:protein KTI12 homolog [Caerostris extrusa]|uniref:Protein KTI12 homolog n=1 Tax=Caerostris extrusa TaxID=172846 RepID=A0AAV4TLG6_CAEEX|nr:protein KTI12 homolog [Caerostris extrusa]
MVELKLENTPPITFVSTYCKPKFTPTTCLKKLIEANKNTIIAGDFNAAHTAWNNQRNSQRGIVLNKFLKTRKDIKIFAPHSHTHISTQARYGNSIIDFALLRNIPYNTSIEVVNEFNSDHLPVIVTLQLHSNLATSTQRKITNWYNYNFTLHHTPLPLTEIHTTADAEHALAKFTHTISDALDKTSRPHFGQPGKKLPVYIRTNITNRNKIRKAWQRSKDPALKESLKKLTNIIKKQIAIFNSHNWSSFTENLSDNNTTVILNAANYIKGYRYELYCLNKSCKTTHCVIHCDLLPADCWIYNENRNSPEKYSEEIFKAVIQRYETPDSRNRWDSPLFIVHKDEELPLEDIEGALYRRRAPPPICPLKLFTLWIH